MFEVIRYNGNLNTAEIKGKNKISSNSQKCKDIPKLELEVMNILNFIKFKNYYCQINPLFQKNLKNKISNYSKVARKTNVSRNTISRILNKERYWMNLLTLLNVSKLFNINKREIYKNIKYIKTHNSFPISFDIKNLSSPTFFRVIGHILGDGGIHVIKNEGKYRAFYVNNEMSLLQSFVNDSKSLFKGIRIYSRKRQKHGDEVWLPTTVGYLFYQVLDYKKLSEKRIPQFVFDSNNPRLISSLLQALYDDEGGVYPNKNMIVISQKSKKLLKDIRECVKNVGISPNQILTTKPNNRSIMHYFSITGKENILNFAQRIGFLHPIKKRNLKA